MTDEPSIDYYIERRKTLYHNADILNTYVEHTYGKKRKTHNKIIAIGLANLATGQVLISELLIRILKELQSQNNP